MDNLKSLYGKNLNIMRYFREHGENKNTNSMDAVLCAYDYQAGSYTQGYFADEIVKNTYIYKGEGVELKQGEYTRLAAKGLTDIMNNLEFQSILEVGTGEATTICDILLSLNKKIEVWGVELSLSRLLYAKQFVGQKKVEINLAAGDMFSLPFADDSIDLVFTYYCIDAHRGKEKQAIEEMLRVSNRYLILVEPSYELGNDATKKRINEQCYIKNLKETLKGVPANVLEHRLFDIFTYNNNAAVTILEKKSKNESQPASGFACPDCKNKLIFYKKNAYCEECYHIYPVIQDIPVLLHDNAILCSKYTEF